MFPDSSVMTAVALNPTNFTGSSRPVGFCCLRTTTDVWPLLLFPRHSRLNALTRGLLASLSSHTADDGNTRHRVDSDRTTHPTSLYVTHLAPRSGGCSQKLQTSRRIRRPTQSSSVPGLQLHGLKRGPGELHHYHSSLHSARNCQKTKLRSTRLQEKQREHLILSRASQITTSCPSDTGKSISLL